MTTVELLAACRAADNEIKILEQRLDRLRAVSMAPPELLSGGRSTDEMDRMAGRMASVDQLEQAIERRKEDKARQEVACALLIDMALDGERKPGVVFAYYVERKSYKEIAADHHISISRVKNLKLEALGEIREVGDDVVERLLNRRE